MTRFSPREYTSSSILYSPLSLSLAFPFASPPQGPRTSLHLCLSPLSFMIHFSPCDYILSSILYSSLSLSLALLFSSPLQDPRNSRHLLSLSLLTCCHSLSLASSEFQTSRECCFFCDFAAAVGSGFKDKFSNKGHGIN